MPTNLILTPVGAGKTEYVLQVVAETILQRPFDPVWILLPARRQEDAFRQRLAEREQRVYFNITFFNFYSLYARLLDNAGQPQRELDDTARLRLLRVLLTDLQKRGELQVFHTIADKPGFARLIADFIYELKQNVIEPDTFASAARTPKDHDLARIYATYQDQLRDHDLVDREGEGWLALAETGKHEHIGSDIALLVADGFDQFNPLQTQLLTLLSTRAQKTIVTLPTIPGRESTVGRRFDEALHRLQAEHDRTGQPFLVSRIPPLTSYASARQTALQYLSDASFVAEAVPRPSDGCLTLIEAPDPVQEAGAILRRVKQLLLTCQPDDILIAVRDWEKYGRPLQTLARVYGIPVALHYGDTLGHNPAIIALLNLLSLSQNDFRRLDLLDVLRSPYFIVRGLESSQCDLLEQVSLSQQVIGGRDEWLAALKLLAAPPLNEEGEVESPILSSAESQVLSESLSEFFDYVTPPSTAFIMEYLIWLEDRIGIDEEIDLDDDEDVPDDAGVSLHMLRQIRLPGEDARIINRDLIALKTLKDVLRSLFSTQNLFVALDVNQEQISWQDFLHDLKALVGSAVSDRSPNRSGRVLITTVADARGLSHKHVLIPGLSEGVFPAPAPEDPLYLDTERQALSKAQVRLETQAERAADAGLFYELISLAQETLTLSRPTVQNGAIWLESHLWRAVKDVFTDADEVIQRIPLASIIPADQVASAGEAVLAVADGLNQSTAQEVIPLYNWVIAENPDHWQRLWQNRRIELKRMSSRGFDHYSGKLNQPDLLHWVADELGSGHVWSASQFNEYGTCAFRFFARRLLKLEKLKEPEEGLDAAQRGTLNHAILEAAYGEFSHLRLPIAPEHLEEMLKILRRVAKPILEAAPRTIGFRASALWEQEKTLILRKLEALLRLDFSVENPVSKLFGDLPRYPYRQEMPFGTNGQRVSEIEIADDKLKVTGYIDRIDRIGEQAVVIDYKTGSALIPTKEMRQGRHFQMMLYILAGQMLLANDSDPEKPVDIAGGMFWHIGSRKTSGDIHADREEDQEAMNQGLEHIRDYLQAGRSGDFAAQPNRSGHGPCAHYCDYTQFCRVSIMRQGRR